MAYQHSKPYQPGQKNPHKLSRSKIELFVQCPRCFWLNERLKIKRPSGPPFQINKAIDELLKKEFDSYRVAATPHPLMSEYGIKAIPYEHEDLGKWRENFVGVQAAFEPANLIIFGAIDDVWVNDNGELIVVDYKATSKQSDITIDADWQMSYKRQMEIYQWLLRQNNFKVSDMGYFVYANGRLDLDGFNNRVEFKTKIIPYKGKDTWIYEVLMNMKACLEGEMPNIGKAAMGGVCDFCSYAKARTKITLTHLKKDKNSV